MTLAKALVWFRASAFMLALGVAIVAYRLVPPGITDMFHKLNPDEPHRPEGPLSYLLVGPFFLGIGLVLTLLARARNRPAPITEKGAALIVAWTLFFLCFTLFRVRMIVVAFG